MGHLGPDNVRRQFKGMVERCADCGFDLAAGRVEVVPTAHYMMGGVEFAPDCTTERRGLFVAGEDSGGVHGANRLGGNGVANSTVFGGIAGDTIAAWLARERRVARARCRGARSGASRAPKRRFRAGARDPARARIDARAPVRPDVGRRRHRARRRGPRARRARARRRSTRSSPRIGLDGGARAFNLTWHDALNLANLIAVSRVIVRAATGAREFARRALPVGFPGRGRPRDVDVRPRPAARRRARHGSGAGALHARRARRDAARVLAVAAIHPAKPICRIPSRRTESPPCRRTFAAPRCATVNRPGRRFCAQCGAGLPVACPACGFANEAAEIFCGGCGTRLAKRLPSPTRSPKPLPSPTRSRRHLRLRHSRRLLPGLRASRRRRTATGHRPLRGSRRLHADVARTRPRGRPCDARAVLRDRRRDRRALRRQHRQAHRRFGDGRVRRPGRAR